MSNDNIVRVSFMWLVIGVAVLFGLSVMGGMLGVNLFAPKAPSLVEGQNQIVTSVKEVTISPNKSAAQLVENAKRSVVLVARSNEAKTPLVIGSVVTNDGLIVLPGDVPDVPVVAIDWQGKSIPLEKVGSDIMYNLTYLRMSEGVLGPFDMRGETAPVGHTLIVMSRSTETLLEQVSSFFIEEHVLPPQLMPAGIQRLYRGRVFTERVLTGSPLVDDEGRLAGIMLNPAVGLVLPAQEVRDSIQRVAKDRREFNPFALAGFEVRYTLVDLGEGVRFVPEVVKVGQLSPAMQADIRIGDLLLKVNKEPVSWDKSLAGQVSGGMPLEIEVKRGGQTKNLSLVQVESED